MQRLMRADGGIFCSAADWRSDNARPFCWYDVINTVKTSAACQSNQQWRKTPEEIICLGAYQNMPTIQLKMPKLIIG